MPDSGVLLVVGIGLLLGGVAAQDRIDSRREGLRPLLTTLAEPAFDPQAFLELCERARRTVPGLLAIVTDGGEATPVAVRARARALRALRLIGAPGANRAMPVLFSEFRTYLGGNYRDLDRTIVALFPYTTDPAAYTDALAGRLHWNAVQGGTKGGHPRDRLTLLIDTMRCEVRRDTDLLTDLARAIEQLSSDDPLAREYAAECLGRQGPEAARALDALRVAATTDNHPRSAQFDSARSSTIISHDCGPLIKDAASIAIARIAPADPLARRGHALLPDSDDPRERVAAAMSLSPPTDDCVDVTDELLAATHDDDALVAGEAVTALGRAWVPSNRARKRLEELVAEGGALGARAKVALERFDPKPEPGEARR